MKKKTIVWMGSSFFLVLALAILATSGSFPGTIIARWTSQSDVDVLLTDEPGNWFMGKGTGTPVVVMP